MKSNTHKIADAMACVSREVINQTINLKEELVDSMKNETEYDKPYPSAYRRETLSLSLNKPISQSDVEGIIKYNNKLFRGLGKKHDIAKDINAGA